MNGDMMDSTVYNYPFTEGSNLTLSVGHRLNPGVVISANIYPTVIDAPGYLYVDSIDTKYIKNGIGCMILRDSNCGDIGLELLFNLASAAGSKVIAGSAVQLKRYCGSVEATVDLVPLLTVDRSFTADDFIFSPSVYHPRLADNYLPETNPSVVSITGDRIVNISCVPYPNSDRTGENYYPDFYLDTDGGIVDNTSKDDGEYPVKRISINDSSASNFNGSDFQNINIVPRSGSRVRTLIDEYTNSIMIGRADDLPLQ